MIHIVRWILIAIGIALILPWQFWIYCGWLADKRAQRKHA